MKDWKVLVFGILIGLLFSGVILFMVNLPRGEAIKLSPPATPGLMSVYVTGAVKKPGVYSLSSCSRVTNAILAAGGFSSEANQMVVNLASPLRDGQKILIPTLGPTQVPQSSGIQNTPTQEIISSDNPININDAALEDLVRLPGIGEAKAKLILEYRDLHGFFHSIDELKKIPGIGPSIFNQIKELITI